MEPTTWSEYADPELAMAATLGQMAAFDELVRRYRAAVVAVARRIVGDAAEDVAQDALLLAFKALPQLDDPERFAGWLAAITRNRALRWARSSAQREDPRGVELDRVILEHTPHLAAAPSEPERDLVRAERGRELRAAVAELPDEIQLAVLLHYFEGLTAPRVAAFLELPPTTVKWRLHRGRQLLRERLSGLWNVETDDEWEPMGNGEIGEKDEREERRGPARAAAAGARAGRDREDGAGSEPDRAVGRGAGYRDPAVQRHSGATGTRGRRSGGHLRAAAGNRGV
jgi:RNA polymerase sigma-70 factor (ECF subfamily)